MEMYPVCEEATVEVETEPTPTQAVSGNNHSTRLQGTHEDEPPASPAESTRSPPGDVIGTPMSDRDEDDETVGEQEEMEDHCGGTDPENCSTPSQPPSPEGPPPPYEEPEDNHLFDHVTVRGRKPPGYGWGIDRARDWPRTPVAPQVQDDAEEPVGLTGDAATTHMPAADPRRFHRLGVLSDRDLTQLGTRPEDVNLCIHDVGPYEQAYPYARRYARPMTSEDIKALFNCLGLAPRGFLRVDQSGNEEYGFHPTVLSALMNADWRLESQMQLALLTPIYPSVVPQLDINTSVHNLTDARFSVAPMFMPVAPSVAFASRLRWLPVQRGLLQTLEELARVAIHNQSAILHAIEEVQAYCGLAGRAPDLMLAMETMLVQQTATLVELVHQVIYAHRHAYVRDSPAWFRHGVLRQPIFNQRQLFKIPDDAYTSVNPGH